MATPQWFRERRYGMFVHANIATVPAFAPMHEYADWYWAFLETEARHRAAPDVPVARGGGVGTRSTTAANRSTTSSRS